MSDPVNLDWLREQAWADMGAFIPEDEDLYTLGVLALLDAYKVTRDALESVRKSTALAPGVCSMTIGALAAADALVQPETPEQP